MRSVNVRAGAYLSVFTASFEGEIGSGPGVVREAFQLVATALLADPTRALFTPWSFGAGSAPAQQPGEPPPGSTSSSALPSLPAPSSAVWYQVCPRFYTCVLTLMELQPLHAEAKP
jgi:hypothetical protein